jgi:hypothetical protein
MVFFRKKTLLTMARGLQSEQNGGKGVLLDGF